MKTRDLIRLFMKKGWWFERHGSNHDIYTNGKDTEQIVRHRETNEKLARALIRKYKL